MGFKAQTLYWLCLVSPTSNPRTNPSRFPTLKPCYIEVQPGSTYWKIVKVDGHNGGQSVFGFVRKADGAILKAAGWKAPYVRGNNYVRGYVMEDDAIAKATPYGIVYAQH